MRTRLPTFALATLLASAPLPAQDDAPPSSASAEVFQREVRPLLADLCFRCHGETKQKGSMRLDTLDPALPTPAVANHWKAVLDALQAGDMPPEEEPQPSVQQRRVLVQWMQGALEGAAERLRGEQRVVLRRLTREQYGNALQELLGLPIEIGARLPPEAKSKIGFSNSGEVLDASPLMLESMQEIARAALDQAIVSGERPAPSRYRVRFGRGIGKGHLAGVTGGYQAEPLTTDDFRLELLDVNGNELVPVDEAQKKELESLRRRISVGFRGSSRERFRVVDEGLILLSGLPHREKPSESWQGPSPNVALEMQRCWPERGAFALRIEASRGYVPPLRKDLLLKLDERLPLASWTASEGLRTAPEAIVLEAKVGDERRNLREEEGEPGLLLLPVEVPKESHVRFHVELPRDGYYQIDFVHRPMAAEAMPSVRLSAAGQNLDHRPFASPEELAQKRVVTALGAIGMRAGGHHLHLGGPFFVGVSQLIVTPLSEDHPLVVRLRAREKAQDEELSALVPVLRVYAGTRTDDGMDYLNFGAPREVHAPLGAPEVYEFFGRMENLPIPELDWVDREELTGFLLMGLWNDHLVKSPQQTGPPLLVRSIEFEAPWFESWPPRTHTAIFPPVEAFSLSEKSAARDGYTKVVLHLFLTRTFRRPVAPGEVERYFQIWKSIEDEHPIYAEGVKEVLLAILCSPHFLFLVEPEELGSPLSEHALATRLAFFLWNAPPDARLRNLADAGELRAALVEEVDRLLADPRARSFVRSFASEWLRLDRQVAMTIDPDRHPEYTRFVKRDLGEETVQYLLHVLRNDLPVRALIDSDFALLNQNLAEYYGVPGVPGVLGPEFRPVTVSPEQQRGGLLVQGAFLAGHSNGLEPHPIKRAVWLKERLLGSPPPPPPPNVPALDPATPGFEKLTLQEQLAAHRDKDACRDCHAGIDPFGVAFEQLSAAGRFEPQRKGRAIDARSTLPDGTEVEGLRGLVAWLQERKIDDVARSFLEHLYAYALGRDLSFADEPALESLLEGVREDGYRARSLVHRIVTSQAFTHR